MYYIYTINIDFCTKKININIQKINRFYLNIFKIIIINCLVKKQVRNS